MAHAEDDPRAHRGQRALVRGMCDTGARFLRADSCVWSNPFARGGMFCGRPGCMGMAMEGGAREHDMNVVSTVVDRHGCQGAGGVVFVVLCKFLILLVFCCFMALWH